MRTEKQLPALKQGEEPKIYKNGKPLHGHDGGEKLRSKETWTWLKEGKLKRETEALIIAAQDKAIQANFTKNNND